MSEETRSKLSESRKGVKRSKEKQSVEVRRQRHAYYYANLSKEDREKRKLMRELRKESRENNIHA